MKITNIVDYDIVNYKLPSMFLGTSKCNMKCGDACQNKHLLGKGYWASNEDLIDIYKENPLTKAVVIGGLEPLDTFDQVLNFIVEFRKTTDDDIVIYTGYREDQVQIEVGLLATQKNIIIKFGGYRENSESRFDDVLGVELASNNQYARRIS